MKISKFALLALLLWAVTIAVFAWFFMRGNTTQGDEGRTAIVLRPAERDFVMKEMRGLLSSTQQILDAGSQGDVPRIVKAARSAGMAGAADANPTLVLKLPIEFKRLAMGMHGDMDKIAKAGESGTPMPELLKMTSSALEKCVACHAVWQIKAER